MVMEGEEEGEEEVRFCSLLNNSKTIKGTVLNDRLKICNKILKTIMKTFYQIFFSTHKYPKTVILA